MKRFILLAMLAFSSADFGSTICEAKNPRGAVVKLITANNGKYYIVHYDSDGHIASSDETTLNNANDFARWAVTIGYKPNC